MANESKKVFERKNKWDIVRDGDWVWKKLVTERKTKKWVSNEADIYAKRHICRLV